QNKYFLLPFATIWIVGFLCVLLYSKVSIHLFCNNSHSALGDILFPYITLLGESVPFIVAAILLFFHVRNFLKNYFNAPRPRIVFEKLGLDLYTISGVELHSWNSFPSGHTMAGFAFFFSLAILLQQRYWKVVMLFCAVFTGYSRIYLNQHFLQDILAGSLLAIIIVLLVYPFFNNEASWGNKSLIPFGKKKSA
nr:phosphatase PAP2 family protein [Paludibacteraceae bacterium]